MKTETVVLFAQVQSTYKELNCDVYQKTQTNGN